MNLKDIYYKVDYFLFEVGQSIVAFLEMVKYMCQHISFLWKSKSVRVWDSSYLLKLLEYRLKRLHDCMTEDEFCVKSRLESLTKCLRYFDEYNNIENSIEVQDKALKNIFRVMSNNIEEWYT